MSLWTLLFEYIFDFSLLRLIYIDDVISMFNRLDQCQEESRPNAVFKQCQNKNNLTFFLNFFISDGYKVSR